VVRRLIENQNITADFALPIARPLRVKFRTRWQAQFRVEFRLWTVGAPRQRGIPCSIAIARPTLPAGSESRRQTRFFFPILICRRNAVYRARRATEHRMTLESLIAELIAARHLSDEQAHLAVQEIVDEKVPAALKADFLCHLALKGETVGEITAFARALREKAVQPPLDPAWRNTHEILDVCGTGGDRLNTFNISTTVAIICAGAGVPVAKHGNRAITSQAGSADVLEALGIKIDLPPAEAARSLRERHFAFFFAPNYHPAFKHIGPARKLCADRGQRTIFNFLGPLLNPALPSAQLVGVPRPELCEPLARVLQSLGARRGMVVSGEVQSPKSKVQSAASTGSGGSPAVQYLDELSTMGDNTVAEFYQERGFTVSALAAGHFPVQAATLADLAGGNRETNAEIVRRILRGDERGPKRDAVLLNAAAGLFVANRARSLSEGWGLAAELIDSGKAFQKLNDLKG
jgi:anthranilate phosphoribosyltransferase